MRDAANDSAQAPRRRGGRPRNADRPVVPWEEVDRLLVFGETMRDEDSGRETVRFPSYRELGRRYGVSGSLISRYASQHQCMKRREENQRRERLQYEQKIVEKRAEARALATEEAVEIVDAYMRAFRDALAEGRVRTDSAGDFNTMARLKEFLGGKADARQEVHGVITLEQLQERHQAMRAQLAALDPVVAGTVAAHERGRGDGGKDGERLRIEEGSRDTGAVDPVLAGLERPRRAMPAAAERPRHRRREEDDDEVADEAAREEELAHELARRGKRRRAARELQRAASREVRVHIEDGERSRPHRDDDVGVHIDDGERPRVRRNVEARRSRDERTAPRARGERAAERMAPERRRPRLRGER